MKTATISLMAGALLLAPVYDALPQYAPPPPPTPFPGFVNEALRARDPSMNQWDIGGSARLRFEAREGFDIGACNL